MPVLHVKTENFRCPGDVEIALNIEELEEWHSKVPTGKEVS